MITADTNFKKGILSKVAYASSDDNNYKTLLKKLETNKKILKGDVITISFDNELNIFDLHNNKNPQHKLRAQISLDKDEIVNGQNSYTTIANFRTYRKIFDNSDSEMIEFLKYFINEEVTNLNARIQEAASNEQSVRELFYDINQYDIDEIEYTKQAISMFSTKTVFMTDNIFENFLLKSDTVYDISKFKNSKNYLVRYIKEKAIYSSSNGGALNHLLQSISKKEVYDIYSEALSISKAGEKHKLLKGMGGCVPSVFSEFIDDSVAILTRNGNDYEVYDYLNDFLIIDSGVNNSC